MTKRFNDYTDAELLTLSNETINDAIRIEAIQRGVEPPIQLSEALRKSEWRGWQKPAEAIAVFEIVLGKDYGSRETGLAYLSKERAESVLEGAMFIENNTYSTDKGYKLRNAEASIAQRWVGTSQSLQAWAKLEEFAQDNTKFEAVMQECVERLSKARQADYDRRVNLEKRAEYMRLAGGDEAIAKAFWAKIQSGPWPEEVTPATAAESATEKPIHFNGKAPE